MTSFCFLSKNYDFVKSRASFSFKNCDPGMDFEDNTLKHHHESFFYHPCILFLCLLIQVFPLLAKNRISVSPSLSHWLRQQTSLQSWQTSHYLSIKPSANYCPPSPHLTLLYSTRKCSKVHLIFFPCLARIVYFIVAVFSYKQ